MMTADLAPFQLLSELPGELALACVLQLAHDARSLLVLSRVSRLCARLANDEACWRKCYEHLIAGKCGGVSIPPARELHPFVDWSMQETLLKSISIKEIKQLLRRRQFMRIPEAASQQEVAGALERFELLALLRKSFPAWLAPPLSVARYGASRLLWSSKYKLSYAAAIQDGKRTFITAFELCNPEWRFTFSRAAMQNQQAQNGSTQNVVTWSVLEVDGSYKSGLIREGHAMEWQFLGEPEGSIIHPKEGLSSIREEHEKKRRGLHVSRRRRAVQIEHYPALRITRTPDWRWVLQNEMALLTSTETSRILPDNPELWERFSRWPTENEGDA
ncbi:hypothetical protein M427DRAFT_404234 [Gonapodya prolifera JEL478]|uniref:F-box domain-containing protein n=1 Tax=Gonapodya prolifera (strain JEL478) TaxID=1344416 RepID=A0A139ATY1_GONPJ|nr:hypothetical protein M427DRAFT_404234 [Gonapodya prolifera JEL478]|eukprot:KXS20192.1 hypothetical protein M427DRAFT_404234 [Gonapodya prolifera JEL478]